MAIRPPNNQKNAIPTRRGWIHPTTGELLVGGSISQKNIDAYMDSVQEEVTITIQDDVIDWEEGYDDEEWLELNLENMSKKELIETAEDWEIEIDPKATKAAIKEILERELF